MRGSLSQRLLLAAVAAGAACTKHGVVDAMMVFAPRTSDAAPPPGSRFLLLAGDMHCHVEPPDHPEHVGRGLTRTLELARDEGLDFVVLTPHVGADLGSGDYADEDARAMRKY